ncbi:MAG: site-specific integrase [Dysgonamonadaceae bacterium]|jgi:integrase|nr:site-specific integrase [Dysgonamonadaceae bacterium]
MKINFFPLNKSKDKTSIQAIIRYKGQRYTISVGESILTKYWNAKTHRCRLTREYPEAPYINQRLDEWQDLIKEIFNELDLLVVPTNKMIQEAVKRKIHERNQEQGGVLKEAKERQYLVPFAIKFTDEAIRAKETKKRYMTVINKLKDFENQFHTKLRFIDIDIRFYNQFKKWLLEQSYVKAGRNYRYSKNYTGTMFKNIKTFMNEAKKAKLHTFDGYEHTDFKVESEDTDAIYLNMNEIEKIYKLEFTESFLIQNGYDSRPQNLKRATSSLLEERDRFLIGCFTALRHSDYSRLETLHFRENLITIWTKKKDKKVYIPMHHLLRKILERRNNVLPAPISDQKHNAQIKEIGKLAGIDEEVLLTKTRGGKRENITGKKYEFITTHTARRSGASNMYLAGIDIKYIQEILGHSKMEQTIKYIKVAAEENAKRLQNHPYFTGEAFQI